MHWSNVQHGSGEIGNPPAFTIGNRRRPARGNDADSPTPLGNATMRGRSTANGLTRLASSRQMGAAN